MLSISSGYYSAAFFWQQLIPNKATSVYTIYGFAIMLIVVRVGEKKLEEELLCTGTQEVPKLKSAQKLSGSDKFGQPEIFLSNENVAWPCHRDQSYKRTSRYSMQSCCVWYLIQIMNLVLQYLFWYSVKVDPPYYCCASSIC